MTNAQQKKLDTIVGKLEALQNDTADNAKKIPQHEKDAMRVAKQRLMSILEM